MKIWHDRKSRILLSAIGAVALLGVGGAALAKPDAARGADGKRGDLCAKLGCTDTQREQLRAVMTELRADGKADRAAIERLHQQLAAEFAKDKPDEAAMRSIQAKIGAHQAQLEERRLDAMLEVHALLDAKQRAAMAEGMKRHGLRGMMRGGKAKHGGKAKGKDKGKSKREAAG